MGFVGRLCALIAIGLMGCGRVGHESDEINVARQQLIGGTACTSGTNCEIRLSFPSQFLAPDSTSGELGVLATQDLVIRDRAEVQQSSGALGIVANTGTGFSEVGSEARIGTLWVKGNVTIRSRAFIGGPAYIGGTLDKQDPITIGGGRQPITNSGTPTATWTVTFPTVMGPNHDLQPGTTRSLSQGRYGDIAVKSGARLNLQTGTYYFESLTLEPQAILNLNNSGGTVVIYVRGQITHRGTLAYAGSTSDLLIGSFSTDAVRLESEFNGSIIAPYGTIVLGTANGATHDGAFVAKNVEVQAGARVRHKETTRTGPAIDSIDPTTVGDPSVTAPPPPSPDGKSFEQYQREITAYVQGLANQGFMGTVELPTHPDAQGLQDPDQAELPPGSAATPTPLPATFSGTIEDARREARDSLNDAIEETEQRLPDIDPNVPTPPAPQPPPPETWAAGFCPLENTSDPVETERNLKVDDGFFLGNLPDPQKTFDAFWNASGHLRAGLDSTFKAFADAGFQTSVGVGMNIGFGIDPFKLDLLALKVDAEAGSIVNDGRIFSVPYAKATVQVFGADVKSWKLPEDVPSQTEECRNQLKACQKDGGIYDQCCSKWLGTGTSSGTGNRVVDTSNCLQDDFCTFEVEQCRQVQQNTTGCIDAWTLAIQPLKVDLFNRTIDFLNPPLTFPMGGITIFVNGGLEVGIPSYLGVDETGPDLKIAPFNRVFVKATAEAGAVIYVAVEGQLDLIRIDVPFEGNLKWRFNQSPEVCQAVLSVNATVKTKWSTLNGRILASLYMRVWIPFVGNKQIEIAKMTIFKWEGFTVESPAWELVNVRGEPFIPLNPATCLLGGQSCAVESTPNHTFDKLFDEGQAFHAKAAPYGQQDCAGQAIVQIPNDALGFAYGLLVFSTWDQVETTAPCTSRHSEFTVWVQRDEGRNGPGQATSPFYNWENWDAVSADGVEVGGACVPQRRTRRRDLPDALSSLDGAPWSLVPLQRDLPSGRVTHVKIVGHATGGCTELPLEFQSVVLYDAP